MKVKTIILLLSIILFPCCSCTHIMRYQSPDKKMFISDLNIQLEGKKAVIYLKSGEVIKAKDIHIGLDSSSWIGEKKKGKFRSYDLFESSKKWSISTLEVHQIILSNHSKGALEGFFSGILYGTGTGLLLTGGKVEGLARGLLVYVGSIGGVIGLAAGALSGHKEKYVFSTQADSFETSK